MGIITDILKGLPISAIQAEKITGLEKELESLKAENAELKKLVKACPRCKSPGWHVESIRPDPIFGAAGGSEVLYKCSECSLEQRVVTDKPAG